MKRQSFFAKHLQVDRPLLLTHIVNIEIVPREDELLSLADDCISLGPTEKSIEHDACFSGTHEREHMFPKKDQQEHAAKQDDGYLAEMMR